MPEMIMTGGWHPSVLPSDVVKDNEGRTTAGVIGRFRKHKVVDPVASRAAGWVQGMPGHEEYVRYRTVVICERKSKFSPDVDTERLRAHNWKSLAARFPAAWAEFEEERLEVTGTPLAKLELPPEKIMAFWCEGIRSVEECAGMPDPICERIGLGAKDLRKRAEDYLASLDTQVPKRGPGRPPKAETMEMIGN